MQSYKFAPSLPRRQAVNLLPTSLSKVVMQHYNRYSKTLDLSDKVSDSDLFSALEVIQTSPFYEDIEDLKLNHNKFVFSFAESNHQFIDLLPPNLKVLDLSYNQLSGSDIPWNSLPSTLQYLYLQSNGLKGTIEWRLLPPELKMISVRDNDFEGDIKWDEIPKKLRMIVVSTDMADSSMELKPDNWDRYQNSFFHN